jgi:hypothetical protein
MAENKYIPLKEPQSPAEAGSMTRDEVQRLIAQRKEQSARAQLSESLVSMGRFEEALAVENRPDRIEWIQKLAKAEAREDDHRCNCTAHIDVTDYTRLPDAKPTLIETPHYIRTYRLWSTKYNAMVWFHQCSVCGCVQSLPDNQSISEINDTHYGNKAAALDAAIAQGLPIREL